MDAKHIFVGGGLRREEILGSSHPLAQELFGDEPELLRGKNVRAEIQVVAVVIDKFEGEHQT